MSEEKSRKPNLNQILQSQKLMTEVSLLQNVINFLHGRICSANYIPQVAFPGFPSGQLPRMQSFPVGRSPGGRGTNFFGMPPEEQPDMGMDYRMPPEFQNLFGMQQNHVLNILPHVFRTDPEKITIESLEKITAGLQDIQKQILDMMSEAALQDDAK